MQHTHCVDCGAERTSPIGRYCRTCGYKAGGRARAGQYARERGGAIITDETVKDWARRFAAGETMLSIAQKERLDPSTVSQKLNAIGVRKSPVIRRDAGISKEGRHFA